MDSESAVDVGAVRDAHGQPCDDASAESLMTICTTELIRRRGPWRGRLDDLDLATLGWAGAWIENATNAHTTTERHPTGDPRDVRLRTVRMLGSTTAPSHPRRLLQPRADWRSPGTGRRRARRITSRPAKQSSNDRPVTTSAAPTPGPAISVSAHSTR